MPPQVTRLPELSFLGNLALTRQAVAFAQEHHGDRQRDADGAPFLFHPLEVAALLQRESFTDWVIAAAVLHDILEDSDVDSGELEQHFGPDVCELVAVVSDNPSIEGEEGRKRDTRERVRRFGGDALAVYAADKISKVRELRTSIARGLPADVAETKKRRYRLALKMLEEEFDDSRLTAALRFELEALEQLPPRP